MNHASYVIIGTSAAGLTAARTLRTLDKDAHIICISDEPETPYNKCFLADYLAGQKEQAQVCTITAAQIDALQLDIRLNTKVITIQPDERTLICADGTQITYDKLLLATGRRPRTLPIFDRPYTNLFYFHTLHHAEQLLAYVKQCAPSRALVIGAGLSGIEVADALAQKGVQVHIVERSAQLLNYHLTAQGSSVLQAAIERAGNVVHLQKNIVSMQGSTAITQVTLDDGTCIAIDMVVIAAGSLQNNELAKMVGLASDQHGLIVNQFLQTSQEHIYAAGDIISIVDTLSGNRMASCTWPDAMQQGRYAAQAMTEQPKMYPGAAIITSSAFFGFKLYSAGLQTGIDYRIVEKITDASYERYIMSNNQLKGFMLLSDGKSFAQLKQALLTGKDVNL